MLIKNVKKSQQLNCLLCGQKKTTNNLLCKKCGKNPFNVELLRESLALKKDYVKLLSTYDLAYTEIRNNNTGIFWDNKFFNIENYRDQDPMTREKIDFVVSLLPKKESKILDMGIGQGYIEQRLDQLGTAHKIYGIDISKTAINRAKQEYIGEFFTGDILNINKFYKKNFFDVVVAIEVIEHIPPHKILKLYRDVHAILKPGGIFIISTPINEGLTNIGPNPSAHLRAYTPSTLLAEFRISKLKILTSRTFFAFKNHYLIKKIVSKIFVAKWKPNNIVIKAVKI